MKRTPRTVHAEPTAALVRRTVGGALARTVAVGMLTFLAAFLTAQLGGTPDAFLVLGIVLPSLWLAGELLLPRTVLLGGGSSLLAGRGFAADAVFAAAFRSLRDEHAVPAEIEPRRVRVGRPVPGVRNVLRLQLGQYAATVAVAPFGNDLHLGWTVTRRHVPVVTVFRWLVALVAVDNGYLDLIEVEPARALGEVVQQAVASASIVGPDALVEPLAATFGADLPVTEADHRSAS